MSRIHYVCTVGGRAMRMQCIAPVPKHQLYYKGKQVQQWITELLPDVRFIGDGTSPTRMHTLQQVAHLSNVCIVDCDIIPFGVMEHSMDTDTVFAFNGNGAKYGHITLDAAGKLAAVQERGNGVGLKCSGVYFVRSMVSLLQSMQATPNSIAAAMQGADVVTEGSIVRIGDPDDYYNAIGAKWYDCSC